MKQYKLLHYHMDNVNPMYIFGHAIVAGQLASKQIKTCDEYKKACSSQGINCYEAAWKSFAMDMGYIPMEDPYGFRTTDAYVER